ncbi:MAG: YdcF family protein [Pseudomonadota bacterium]
MPRPRLRGLFLLCLLIGLPWLIGLVLFAQSLPTRVGDPVRETDAIVVLTGGSGRVAQGVALLVAERAEKLFISGVYQGVDVEALLQLERQEPDEVACCIALGYQAGDTRGNALETAAWLGAEGFTSLRLVTAAYHMPRSLLEFRALMPDVEVVPHPVFSSHFKQADWWRWPGSASLMAREYSKYLVAWLRIKLSEALS